MRKVPRIAPAQTTGGRQNKQGRGGIGSVMRGRMLTLSHNVFTQRQNRRELRTLAALPRNRRRQSLHARMRKKRTDTHAQTQLLLNCGNHLKSRQRMTTRSEEILIHAETLTTQHARNNRAQLLLQQTVRALSLRSLRGQVEGRQQLAISLTGGAHRQSMQGMPQGRNHVVRQNLRTMLARRLHQLLGTLGGHVAHLQHRRQGRLTQTAVQQSHRSAHALNRGKSHLNIAQLQALTAHLNLVIRAAAVTNDGATIGKNLPARQIARTVQALALTVQQRERTGRSLLHKSRRSRLRVILIAACQLHTRQVQLTRHAHRHGVAGRVKNQGAGVPDRLANGHALALRVGGSLPEGHVHRRLGRAVQVQRVHAQNLARSLHLVLLQSLARADHVAQGLLSPLTEAGIREDAARRRRRGQRRKHGRHKMHRRDGLFGNHTRQVGGVALPIRGGNDHGGTLGERPVQLPHVHVKGDGGLVQNAVALPHRNLVLLPAQAVINRAVADGNTLRPARGAGGEEHVSVLVQAGFRARKLLGGGCRGGG